ncbi:hypothetical protein ACX3YC_21100 [Pseudomonas mohnii]
MKDCRRADFTYSILLMIPVFLYASMGANPLTEYRHWVPRRGARRGACAWFDIASSRAISHRNDSHSSGHTVDLNENHVQHGPHRRDVCARARILYAWHVAWHRWSAWLLRYRVKASLPWIVAGVGFLGAALGFMVAQMIVCNTLMYCGALSFGV